MTGPCASYWNRSLATMLSVGSMAQYLNLFTDSCLPNLMLLSKQLSLNATLSKCLPLPS